MEFYSNINPAPKLATPSGEKTEAVFKLEINKKGIKELVKTEEKTNIYERIQANLEETKIENILKRFEMGDKSVLEENKGTYIDITKLPKTLAEAEQQLIDAKNLFDKQPLEIKKEFGQNHREWLYAINDGTYEKRIEKYNKKKSLQDTTKQNTIQENIKTQLETLIKEKQAQLDTLNNQTITNNEIKGYNI